MSSLLAWCSEERPATFDHGTSTAAVEASSETMMAAVGLEFGKPLQSVPAQLQFAICCCFEGSSPSCCSVRTDHPVPVNIVTPGPNEVVVAVAFVAMNPIDYKLLDGHFGGKGVVYCPSANQPSNSHQRSFHSAVDPLH